MTELRDIDVVVFDILGTLVDDTGGLRAAIRHAAPGTDEAAADELYAVWQRHIDQEHHRIAQGQRAYADSDVLDAEAARQVAAKAGITDPDTVARLATAGRRHSPWQDSAAGLARLARHFRVLGLSNASSSALLDLHAHSGLRWHLVLSGQAIAAYKPAPAAYRFALDTAGCAPDRALMVATHAWDLRGAQACGMRTAYVHRPGGDPPADSDTFDGWFGGMEELATALTPDDRPGDGHPG
ncbi:haloacid dehalogenase type II [Streptomyces sp. ODS28]|uniref:haloacid dehalogenase type II n=1 Tax=Streptomyces sp. ODS28 TaxID=3136688 RepID=UPI0031F10829